MSHEQLGKSDEWYTPKYIFDALGIEFDLDVASPEQKTFVPAINIFTERSLEKEWIGVVWCNPPFGGRNGIIPWGDKFINHANGVMLTPDRTSCDWWQNLVGETEAHLHIKGKVKFMRPDGTYGNQPSNGTTLFAMGRIAIGALIRAEEAGLGKLFMNSKSPQKR